MAHDAIPSTQAVRVLRDKKIIFTPHAYDYEEHGGTARAAAELGIDEHEVIKTLVMETESRTPLIILMHGDREVSTKQMARILGVKKVTPCDPATAQRHTGYLVGGTSPLGTRTALPVFAEESLFSLPRVFLNGGKRGFLVELEPSQLAVALNITRVNASQGDL